MGFFSTIKKLWSSKTEPDAQQPVEPPAAEDAAPRASRRLTPSREIADWQTELRRTLQQAQPRLSVWLDLILADLEDADDQFWSRLHFLLESLEVPPAEAEDFMTRFRKWLQDMDYDRIDEFRSELQYRLALALDLEDEEDEKSRLFIKLSQGLNKTKEQLSKRIDGLLSSSPEFNSAFWEELEEILILGDVGFQTSSTLVERLQKRVREEKIGTSDDFKAAFQKELASLFPAPAKRIKPAPPEVMLALGVNGVGKTTTIAKLAHRAQMQGQKVLLAAGDTFRAAGIEQLEIWAQRTGAGFFSKKTGSDPAAVAYEALDAAQQDAYDLLIVDTAGRLHTQTNLMQELKKIKNVLHKKSPGAPHRTVLVVDGTSGQNVLAQTKLFNEGVGVDEIIITKLDGTAKGGVILGIALEHTIPITFVGLGEKMEDLRPFHGEDFAKVLLAS
jgi:fused signal recognition particle receptor